MLTVKKIFRFYINSSIHVAFSVFSLVKITQDNFQLFDDKVFVYFAFFGTIVAYNVVKYSAIVNESQFKFKNSLKVLITFSLFALLASGIYFFQLEKATKIVSLFFLVVTLLYTFPFLQSKTNARNWSGIKIYIVATCWTVITLFLPVINNDLPITSNLFLEAIQRFILFFVLILIFEIIDLKLDDPHLRTIPQQMGVLKTKRIGIALMLLFVMLEFLWFDFRVEFFIIKLALAVSTSLFLLFSNENRSRYYASFWVESIPIFWWLSLVVFKSF